jgi:copper chaperone NosL
VALETEAIMRLQSRLSIALAALLLVPAYWLPLWSIRIAAPQYKEGLGMYIGLRDIWGHGQHDIQNINILNHYIGMKPIDPAVVDVLTLMPWVVGLLMVGALAVAALGRRWLVGAWLAAFVALGTAGLMEFYAWNHDYGHNLDPAAPIKVPGMTYQPPLIGVKQLLNMTTSSWPSWGTLFIGLSFAAGVAALLLAQRRATPHMGGTRDAAARAGLPAAAAAVLLLAAGCGAAPAAEAGDAGRSYAGGTADSFAAGGACAYCPGEIPEARFGGEVVTADGETFRFMGAECMAAFLLAGRVAPEDVRSVRVVDYGHGERLIDVRDAHFVRMQFEKSPGGLNVAALATAKIANSLRYFHGGDRLDWDGVLAMVRREWEL